MTDEDTEYVYAIGHPEGYVKIGRSKDPATRLRDHQVSSPYQLWIIVQIPTGDSDALETELHDKLSDRHVRGEWFEFDQYDYDLLVELMRIGNAGGNLVELDQLKQHRARITEALFS